MKLKTLTAVKIPKLWQEGSETGRRLTNAVQWQVTEGFGWRLANFQTSELGGSENLNEILRNVFRTGNP